MSYLDDTYRQAPPAQVTPLDELRPGFASITFGARLFHEEDDLDAALRLGYVRRRGTGHSYDGYDSTTCLAIYELVPDPLLDVCPCPMTPTYWDAWWGREEARNRWAWPLWIDYVNSGGDPQAQFTTADLPCAVWLDLTYGLPGEISAAVESTLLEAGPWAALRKRHESVW